MTQHDPSFSTTTDHGADDQYCHHLLVSLSDYVDGELDDSLCQEIEAHMAGCDNCRVVVDTLRMTVDLYRETSAPDLPDDVRLRLYKSLKLDGFLHDNEQRDDSPR